jgi:hypothetical protein
MIKKQLLSLALASSVLAVGLNHSIGQASAERVYNPDDLTFNGVQCSEYQGIPITAITFNDENGKSRIVPLITWSRKYIKDANWSPSVRCSVVSKRIDNEFQKEKKTNFYFTTDKRTYTNTVTGVEEEADVLCFTRTRGQDENGDEAKCSSLFLTLAPTERPNQVLREFRSMFSEAGFKTSFSPISRGKKTYVGLHDLTSQIKKNLRNGTLVSYPAN